MRKVNDELGLYEPGECSSEKKVWEEFEEYGYGKKKESFQVGLSRLQELAVTLVVGM